MSESHEGVHRHPAPTSFIRKYIFSVDHKVIGIQYIMLALAAVVVGMVMSLLMRLNLSWPGTSWPILETLFPTGAPGGIMTPEFYLSLVTMHGTIMVFFVLTTAPQGGFGNYFLPIQIGAEDMAFPVLNMLSFWVTLVGFIVILLAIVVEGNQSIGAWFAGLGPSFAGGSGTVGPIGGWTGYAPLSALGKIAGPGQGAGMNLWVISIAIFCVGSLLGALNFITTLLNMRTKGMSLMRMPLTCWAWFTTAVLALLSFPVLLGGGILLLLDRTAGTSFFIPGGLYVSGLLSGSHPTFPLHTRASPLLTRADHASLHRQPARLGRNFAEPFRLCAQAAVWLSRDGLRDLRDRPARLLRVGPPHVHLRHEPVFLDRVLDTDAVDRRAVRGQDIQLARHTVGFEDSLYDGDVVCTGLRFAVCFGWHHGVGAWTELTGSGHARLLLCDCSLPPRNGRCFDLRYVCGNLLLVPEDVWTFHE